MICVLAEDGHNHEIDPDDNISAALCDSSLICRAILSDGKAASAEESHKDDNKGAPEEMERLLAVLLKSPQGVFDHPMRAQVRVAARDKVEDYEKNDPHAIRPKALDGYHQQRVILVKVSHEFFLKDIASCTKQLADKKNDNAD